MNPTLSGAARIPEPRRFLASRFAEETCSPPTYRSSSILRAGDSDEVNGKNTQFLRKDWLRRGNVPVCRKRNLVCSPAWIPLWSFPRINQYERDKHEPQLKTAKRLADVLGIPAAFLYTEDELLAKLLLRWTELSARQKKVLLKQVEDTLK